MRKLSCLSILLFFAILLSCAQTAPVAEKDGETDTPMTATTTETVTREIPVNRERYVIKESFSQDEIKEKRIGPVKDGDNYVWFYYLGELDAVPMQTVSVHRLNGNASGSLKFYHKELDSESIQRSLETARTTSYSNGVSASAGVTIGGGFSSLSASFTAATSRTDGTSETSTITDLVSSSKVTENGQEISVDYDQDWPKGYYRYVAMIDLDVYGFVVYRPGDDSWQFGTNTAVHSLLPYYTIDYSTDSAFKSDDPKQLSLELSLSDLEALKKSVTEGDGAAADPNTTTIAPAQATEIRTAAEFKAMQNASGGNYKLANDIDFNGSVIDPISYFYGVLDGNGKTLSNFKINSSLTSSGLFAVLAGTVKNLKIANANVCNEIQGSDSVAGILAGTLYSTAVVEGCEIKDSSVVCYSKDWDNTDSSDPRMSTAGSIAGISQGTIEKNTLVSNSVLAHSLRHDVAWSGAWGEASLSISGGIVGRITGGSVSDNVLQSVGKDRIGAQVDYRASTAFICSDTRVYARVGGVAGQKAKSGNVSGNALGITEDDLFVKSYSYNEGPLNGGCNEIREFHIGRYIGYQE